MTDQKEIAAIVNENGNSFHCRVASYLQERGLDNAISKPREIALIKEKSSNISNRSDLPVNSTRRQRSSVATAPGRHPWA